METPNEFLQRKGFKKVYQPSKRYNITISELVEFLDEYSTRVLKDFLKITDKDGKSSFIYSRSEK